eukprot:TRINITY_DN1463_c0_g1_i1.p1 TRINITY_DN1463_c0_g1~~TRINITY_DN1463_c0_g1_i1.p1  ORF type:complete len:442 (-),score=104.51 TRINITY_DN1463_c0_g1_i1:185-1510(-)
MAKVKIKKVVLDKIQELNDSGWLQAPLRLGKVARPLSDLDSEQAISVLDELCNNAEEVTDPTSWVCDAARQFVEEVEEEEQEGEAEEQEGEAEEQDGEHEEQDGEQEEQEGETEEVAPTAEDTTCTKYKTSICRHWAHGMCSAGSECKFAHGQADLHDATKFKKVLCKNFASGTCLRGVSCTFAHGQGDLQSRKNFKTVLCSGFVSGTCMEGELCNFAHGEQELLRYAKADPRYKTDLCRHFAAGYCEHGDYCKYAHGPAELKGQAAASAATPGHPKKMQPPKVVPAKPGCPALPPKGLVPKPPQQPPTSRVVPARPGRPALPPDSAKLVHAAAPSATDTSAGKIKIKKQVADYIRELNDELELSQPLRITAVAVPLSALSVQDALALLSGLRNGDADGCDPNSWVMAQAAAAAEVYAEDEGVEEDEGDEPETKRRRFAFG